MAVEEVVVDEFDNPDVVVVEDSATGLTNGLVFFTTVVLVIGIIVVMYATRKWFQQGMFS